MNSGVPFTVSVDALVVEPAPFETTQVYSPACLALTDSIANCLVRLPESVITISCSSAAIGWLLNMNSMFMGKSPLTTLH